MAQLAARQHGVVSLAQLQGLGLGARAAQYRGASGRLHRVHRGVYAVGHGVLSADGHRMAAVLACGAWAVLSHRSAAAVWGIRPNARTRIDVTCQGSQRAGPPGIDLHRARRLAAQDVGRVRGIPTTTVARTLLDLAAVLNANSLERAVHQAEALRLLDVDEVRAAIQRAPGRQGTRRLQAILSMPSPGPTRSELEDRFLELCKRGNLPTPRMNHHVKLESGRLVEADALWPDHRLVAELDSARFHDTTKAFHDDRRRDAALAADDYVVIRLTWQRVNEEADAVLDELRCILALRAREFAP